MIREQLPKVWSEPFEDTFEKRLQNEAAKWYRLHQLDYQSKETWIVYSNELRNKIWHKIGSFRDESLSLDYHETNSISCDGYTIRNIYFQTRHNFYATANLFIPNGDGPFPAVIGLNGHFTEARIAPQNQANGHILAKNGYVCLLIDALGAGERSRPDSIALYGEYDYHGGNLGLSLFNIGETLLGMQLVDNMKGVDLLCSMSFVDKNRIGATGASGGGNQTMYLAAMDQRIKAAMPVVSVGTFESYIKAVNCVCELIPDGLTFMEESSILALVAPRALKLCSAFKEKNLAFVPQEMMRSFHEAQKIYRLYKNGYEQFTYSILNLEHGYFAETRDEMLGFFDYHLKNKGCGVAQDRSVDTVLPLEKLKVFSVKDDRYKTIINIPDYCRRKSYFYKKQLSENMTYDIEEKKQQLSNILHLGEELKLKSIHQYQIDEYWERFAIETINGELFPVLVQRPRINVKMYMIITHTYGKDKLYNHPLLKEAQNKGAGIILCDLWGQGEHYNSEHKIDKYHQLSRWSIWLGKTILGKWCETLQLIIEFAYSLKDCQELVLAGERASAVAALFGSIFTKEKIDEVILYDAPVSYEFGKVDKSPNYFTMAIHLFGIIPWGDLPLACKITNSKVRWINPRKMDGELTN